MQPAGRGAARRFDQALLVRGTRHLRAGARRRQAALPGAHLERRPCAPHRHRPPDRARPGRRRPDAALVLLRLGHPHGGGHRGPLQPDELPQRLGLAARQRADRRRLGPLRLPRRGGARSSRRPVRRLDLHRPAAAAGALLRLPAAAQPGPTFYPVACSPQAWAAAATLSLLRSCLGIGFDPENDYVIFDQPVLPRLRRRRDAAPARLGDGSIDVEISRADGGAAVHVLAREGALRALTRS